VAEAGRPANLAATVTLRDAYRPLRSDLDGFLFSQLRDERSGVPLSMVSALTRLGLDPREEAARLCSLSKREAAEQLARLIAELPDASGSLPEARSIAVVLIERLPKFGGEAPAARPIRRPWRPRWPTLATETQLYVLCVAVAAAVLLSILLHAAF
jgi:hypothetical protein